METDNTTVTQIIPLELLKGISLPMEEENLDPTLDRGFVHSHIYLDFSSYEEGVECITFLLKWKDSFLACYTCNEDVNDNRAFEYRSYDTKMTIRDRISNGHFPNFTVAITFMMYKKVLNEE